MNDAELERSIWAETVVSAPRDAVWDAWTTEKGARSFFAPECLIEAWAGGRYEMYFDLDMPEGQRGGEGLRFLALQPKQMLSFTWNATPNLTTVRDQHTHVVVRLLSQGDGHTRVTLRHDGWGWGGEWDAAFDYFERVWGSVVLPRLKYRFDAGPIDWQNLPDLAPYR